MTERDQLLADLAVMRQLERAINRAPVPRTATSYDWRIYMHQISDRAGTDVMVLAEDPFGAHVAAARRAIWGLEQRLAALVDDERWEMAS